MWSLLPPLEARQINVTKWGIPDDAAAAELNINKLPVGVAARKLHSLFAGRLLDKSACVTSFFLFDHRHSEDRTVDKMVNTKSLNIQVSIPRKPAPILQVLNKYPSGAL